MVIRWHTDRTQMGDQMHAHQRSAHPHHREGALEDSRLLLVRRQVHKVLRDLEVLILLALLLGLVLGLGHHLVGRRPALSSFFMASSTLCCLTSSSDWPTMITKYMTKPAIATTSPYKAQPCSTAATSSLSSSVAFAFVGAERE